MTLPIYHLDFSLAKGHVRVRLNGVPVLELRNQQADPMVNFAPPLNLALVGEANRLSVEMLPLECDDGTLTGFGDIKIEADLMKFEKGDIVAPGEGDSILSIEIPDELRERVREEELELPLSFDLVFDNEGVSFHDEIREAAPYTNESALLDYAERLRDHLAGGEVAALMHEFAPKAAAYAKAYDYDVDEIATSIEDYLGGDFAQASPKTDFARDEIEAVPLSEGRMWELRLLSGAPLFQSEEDDEGGTLQIPIIVGEREGSLKIVR